MQPDEEERTFGAELRRRRTEAGLSLHQLAVMVNYTKGHISRVEKDQKRASEQFARACDRVLDAGGALLALASVPGPGECPFPGPSPFAAEDARWFHGRDRAAAELVCLLADPGTAALPALVIGPSGVGKSSLLRAGLIPAVLRGALPGRRPGRPEVLYLTPTARPVDALRGHEAHRPLDTYALVVVDQFEELFTRCDDAAERTAFIGTLCRLAADGLPVVIGVRADFRGHLMAHPPLRAALRARALPLEPMSAPELREVIIGPAAAAGLALEPGLVEVLLRDVGAGAGAGAGVGAGAGCEPGALPLLAHALRSAWQHRSGDMLTVAGYECTGGVHGMVAATAERVLAGLAPRRQRPARHLLLRLVRVGEGTEDSRRRPPRAALVEAAGEDSQPVLEAFVQARLLTADGDHVAIAHEAVLRSWPRLRGWIDSDRPNLRLWHRLIDAAAAWDARERDPALLLCGPCLAGVVDWVDEPGRDAVLSPLERTFVRAAREHERGRGRTRAAGERRRARRLAAGLSLVALVAVACVLAAARRARRSRGPGGPRRLTGAAAPLSAGRAPRSP